MIGNTTSSGYWAYVVRTLDKGLLFQWIYHGNLSMADKIRGSRKLPLGELPAHPLPLLPGFLDLAHGMRNSEATLRGLSFRKGFRSGCLSSDKRPLNGSISPLGIVREVFKLSPTACVVLTQRLAYGGIC